jgi:hypothetical protein
MRASWTWIPETPPQLRFCAILDVLLRCRRQMRIWLRSELRVHPSLQQRIRTRSDQPVECKRLRIQPGFAMCRRGPLPVPKDDPYIAESFHIRGCPAVRGGAKCSCPPGRTSQASGVLSVNHFAREGVGPQLRDIRRFARKSIQKGAKFFLAGACMPFAPGSDCLLKEPLRIQLQREASRQCFCGKLSLHLRVVFDVDRDGNLAPSPIIGLLLEKVDPKPILGKIGGAMCGQLSMFHGWISAEPRLHRATRTRS